MEPVLGKAMAKDPDQRYPTCLDFVECLRTVRSPRAQPGPLPPARKAKGVGWLAVAAAVAGVLAVAALTGCLPLESHQAVQVEMAYRDSIRGRGDAARFEQYLKEYPSGRFAELARKEIEALRRPALLPPAEKQPPEQALALLKSSPINEPPRSASGKPSPAPGEVSTNPVDGQRYVWIPPGRFRMGCSPGDNQCTNDEKPAHPATISKGFWLGQTEVTIEAFGRFVRAMQRFAPPAPRFPQGRDHPVVNVTWHDAAAYCRWAGGRLPTEAEWEYAARAGSTGPYYQELDGIAWYSDNSEKQTHPVAQKVPNRFGLYDMLGNVWEWVGDWYADDYYAWSDVRDPRGPPGGRARVLRGGSWLFDPRYLRASFRYWGVPGRDDSVGFRCAREVIP